jgi:peptidyl-prolyl cis-trans isomerase D
MLNQMRALSQHWIGRSIMALVLGFIIISFAIWGIGDRFTNFNAGELAKVGSARIGVDQYREAYQNQLQQLQQKERRGITNEEARRLGLDRQVLYRLLSDAVFEQEAVKLGLAVGDDAVARSIVDDESFKGANGQFDRARFTYIMQNSGLTEAAYVRQQRATILRQDVADAVVGGLALPEVTTAQIHRYRSEVRDADFFILPASAAGTLDRPSDADLKAFYDDHAAALIAPEYRKLVVLSIVPANLVKPDAVSDADVQKRYDEMKSARFATPEKRTVSQLVYADPKAATAAKAKLDGGESFDALVAEEKKSPADIALGTVTKAELADPAVADAAFSLAEGATSAPVKGQFGTVLVHVAQIVPSRQQPLMEVSAQLKDEIAIIRASQAARKMRDAIEDQRTAGKTLTEAAASVGLKPRVIDAIDAQGRDKEHRPVEGLVEGPKLLKAAFATDIGADTEMITGAANGDVWYEVAGIEPARQLPLADVKPRVEAGWRAAQVEKRLAAESDKLVAALNGGATLESVVAGLDPKIGKPQILVGTDISRQGGPNVTTDAAAAMFDVTVGKAGSTAGPERGRLIFKVKAARVPPIDPKDDDFTKLTEQVKTGLENDVLAEYLLQVQKEIGVQINQKALQSALGEDAGT